MFVRVKDPSTGHEFDVPETSMLLRRGLVRRVKSARYPPSPVRRRKKYHLNLAGPSATRSPGDSPELPDLAATHNPDEEH